MPEDSTAGQTTEAQQTDSAAAAAGTEPAGGSPSADTDLSESDLNFARLLYAGRDAEDEGTETDETTAPADQTTKQPETRPAPQAGAEEAPGAFDTKKFVASMTDELGAGAEPIAKQIGATFAALQREVADLRAQLGQATGLRDEFGKLRQEIEPIGKKVKGWEEAETRQAAQAERKRITEVHGWFDGRKDYADRYGTGDWKAHSPEQQRARVTVLNAANRMLKSADELGKDLSLPKALQMAEAVLFGEPTRAGAVNAVRGDVKRAARGLSVDPARGGGTRDGGTNLTRDEERQAAIQRAEQKEREYRNGAVRR